MGFIGLIQEKKVNVYGEYCMYRLRVNSEK